MKKSIQLIFTLLLFFTTISCGEKEKKEVISVSDHAEQEKEISDENLDSGKVSANPEFKNERIAAVYGDYLQLKTALVNSKPSEAKEKSEILVNALKNVETGEKALEAAKKISSSEDLDVQRTVFSDLSAEVETLLAEALVSGNIYKQYCPMAFDGKGGYWLSDSEEIRNPYYGNMMLKCGSVRGTLQ